MVIQVKVNGPKGEEKIIDVCDDMEQMKNMTVKQLKGKIKQVFRIDDEIRMVFRAETLEESTMVETYEIRHMSTVHTLLLLPGAS